MDFKTMVKIIMEHCIDRDTAENIAQDILNYHPCGDCAEYPDCKKCPKDCEFSEAYQYDVGIDFITVHDDYGNITGNCIIYCNNSCDEVIVLPFIYALSSTGTVEVLDNKNVLSLKEKEQVEATLLENLKLNLDLSKVPTLDDFNKGIRY